MDPSNQSCQVLLDQLRTAVGVLELPPHAPLRHELAQLEALLQRSTIRIAVFAPFNYGKSTLLNAMLGERALPIDLIPTTGAAIAVRYGSELRSCIQFKNGTTIDEAGTDILKQFAVLDGDRRMREDVNSVEIICPHPFLQTGVEFLDLPGTNDREAQDAVVRDQLMTADLIVQVLDGRKLMTLGEREQLRDWLIERGITTVIFVVNFLNLLDPEEQKQVYHRLRFVAESFRATLPAGISNIYRVDALPALRARLKGDVAQTQTSGLPMLEAALQQIVQSMQERPLDARLPRLKAIAHPIQQALQTKLGAIATAPGAPDPKEIQRVQIKKKAQGLIQQGFAASLSEMRQWLALTHLLDRYGAAAIQALKQFEFDAWVTYSLKSDWQAQQRAVVDWVYKACDFFGQPRPADLWVAFPAEPIVDLSSTPQPTTQPSSSGKVAPVAIATGLGWVFGGPLGALALGGASYLVNRADGTPKPVANPPSLDAVDYLYIKAVQDYFNTFSQTALAALQRYEVIAQPIIHQPIAEPLVSTTHQHHQTQLIQSTLANLEHALNVFL